jgi:cytoskeleton protein RodZ
MPEIGATLREARMRARIDVSEIEAKTKIRAKYLRALENEEWGLLPGPTFVKSFLRTYAQALGLDGKAMVEEYRLHHERPSEAMLEPIVSTPQRKRPRTRTRSGTGGRGGSGDGPSRGYMIAVSVIGVVIIALIVLLVSGGGGGGSTTGTTKSASTRSHKSGTGRHAQSTATHHAASSSSSSSSSSSFVALSLRPTAVVYVCLLGDNGRKLIPGIELQPGETTPTYHARRFEITLGNSSVTMFVDGTPRTVAPSSQAIGYSITKALGRKSLAPGQLPTCQ